MVLPLTRTRKYNYGPEQVTFRSSYVSKFFFKKLKFIVNFVCFLSQTRRKIHSFGYFSNLKIDSSDLIDQVLMQSDTVKKFRLS